MILNNGVASNFEIEDHEDYNLEAPDVVEIKKRNQENTHFNQNEIQDLWNPILFIINYTSIILTYY